MANLNFSHSQMTLTVVEDKTDFFKSGLPEMYSLKLLINVSSRIFRIPTVNIILSVVEDLTRVYCLTLLDATVQKLPIGKIYYLPLEKRLELYDTGNDKIPLYVWIKKKMKFSRTTLIEQRAETHKVFDALVNTLSA